MYKNDNSTARKGRIKSLPSLCLLYGLETHIGEVCVCIMPLFPPSPPHNEPSLTSPGLELRSREDILGCWFYSSSDLASNQRESFSPWLNHCFWLAIWCSISSIGVPSHPTASTHSWGEKNSKMTLEWHPSKQHLKTYSDCT